MGMMKITLELDVAEALTALGPIQDRMMEAHLLAANATGEEHEIAALSAKLLGRVHGKLTDALYPAGIDSQIAVSA